MSIHIELAPKFNFLKDYVTDIPENFGSHGKIVHQARNVIEVDDVKDVRLVIKSYRKIYLFNRFCYAHLLPSKAKRAYVYARRLIEKGFNIPEPVAYIECVRKGMLWESYFISTYTDYQPLKNIMQLPQMEARKILDDLALYTWKLHEQHIYHGDYSIGNILFKKGAFAYEFTLIDNNRMKFGRHDFAFRMKNLRRLDLPLTMLAYICQQYAQISGDNELLAMAALLHYRKKRILHNFRKNTLKKFFRPLFTKL